MKMIIIFIIVLLPLKAFSKECPLEGYWLSNEALTFESIANNANLSPETTNLFSNNFFGKLYIRIDCKEFTNVYIDYIETTEFKIISTSNSQVTMQLEELGETIDKIFMLHGNCFSVQASSGEYREYFCPITKDKFDQALKTAKALIDKGT